MNFQIPLPARRLAAHLPRLLPSSCALCGADGPDSLCADCGGRFFGGNGLRCRQCAAPLTQNGERCGACLKHPPAFDQTVAAADYAPPVDQMVLALKFGGKLALAPLLARLLKQAAELPPELRPDMLTAVPLGPRRLRERGFNQALEIARPLARAMAVKLETRLAVRTRETAAQSLLHPDERRVNVRGAFVVPGPAIERIRGKHIGVVDDVVTTGETLDELAATLKRFGAARVTNFVFARTPLK